MLFYLYKQQYPFDNFFSKESLLWKKKICHLFVVKNNAVQMLKEYSMILGGSQSLHSKSQALFKQKLFASLLNPYLLTRQLVSIL